MNYDYLLTGELSAIRENGATAGIGVLATYAYDNLGRRSGLTRGNGVVTTYRYDAVSRLASLSHDLDGIATTTNDVVTTFNYNPVSQIQSSMRDNDLYAWDGHYNVDRPYGVNGLNQLTAAGATTFGYDARGNLTTSGATAYTYTSENLLQSGSAPTATTITYDGQGRMMRIMDADDNRFIFDGGNIATHATMVAGVTTVAQRYVWGQGEDEALMWYEGAGLADRRFYVTDERGSIVATTNAAGAKLSILSYDDYGIPGSRNSGQLGYTGQVWLASLGLGNFKARIYSPTLGRFLQTDPTGYDDGTNWYAYVANDPVNRADPSGLAGCSSGMSSGDCNTALAAQAQARQDIKNTQGALNGLSKERTAVASGSQKELSGGAKATEGALQKQFGDSGASTIKSVQSSLSAIDKVLADNGSKYQFEHKSIPGDLGKAWPSGSRITLGDAFFRTGSRDQVVTVLHEPGHIANWAGDFGYEGRSRNLPTWLRLNNADDVAIFGYNVGSR